MAESVVLGKGQAFFCHCDEHLLQNSKYMNPGRQWNFRAEDYVGHISKMTHSISFGVGATRISNKVSAKYRVHIHLLLTRGLEGVMDSGSDDDC